MLLKGDEDGNPLRVLQSDDLDELLSDSKSSYGVTKFEDAQWLINHPDPNYWPDGTGILLEVEVVIPKAITRQWSL